jgi:hypothetical protein
MMRNDSRADEVGFILALIFMAAGAWVAVVWDVLTGAIAASVGALGSYYFSRSFDGTRRRRAEDNQ